VPQLRDEAPKLPGYQQREICCTVVQLAFQIAAQPIVSYHFAPKDVLLWMSCPDVLVRPIGLIDQLFSEKFLLWIGGRLGYLFWIKPVIPIRSWIFRLVQRCPPRHLLSCLPNPDLLFTHQLTLVGLCEAECGCSAPLKNKPKL
jgi:hypothetical protein